MYIPRTANVYRARAALDGLRNESDGGASGGRKPIKSVLVISASFDSNVRY